MQHRSTTRDRPDSTVVASSGKLPGMPKKIPGPVKVRIAVLVGDGKTTPEIIATVAAEFNGYAVSTGSISAIRKALNVSKKAGRPVGIPSENLSPQRKRVRALRRKHPKWTHQQIGDACRPKLSRQRVGQILSDGK